MIARHRIGFFRANARLCRQIWQNRRQIALLFWRDFTAPHRKNVLGVVWAYIMPLLPVSAFILLRAFIRPRDLGDAALIDPVVYVALGVTLWLVLRDCVMTPAESVKKYRGLVGNARFPMVGGLVIGFGTVALNTLIRAIACAVTIAIVGTYSLTGTALAFVVLFAAFLLFFSVGILLIPVIAAIPDLNNLLTIIFRYLIFFSGAIWPVPMLFGSDAFYRLNPFAVFLAQIREAIVLGTMNDFAYLLPWLIIIPFVLLLAGRSFYALEPVLQESIMS